MSTNLFTFLRNMGHLKRPASKQRYDYGRGFKVVGRTLEDLHLMWHGVPNDSHADVLHGIRQHYRILRTIASQDTPFAANVFAELVISYGSQMEHLDFEAISANPEACATVQEKCPNVRGTCYTYTSSALGGMAVLASRLEEWHIQTVEHIHQFPFIAARCGTLRRLRIRADTTWYTTSFVRFFGSFETASLRVLHLSAPTLTVTKILLEKLRSNAVRLCKVHMHVGTVECLDEVGKLFDSYDGLQDVYF